MEIKRYDPFIQPISDDLELAILQQLSSSPLDNIFNLNYVELRKNSKTVKFKSSRYNMRPDLVAWDYYNSLAMTNLIILVNNCTTVFNFTRDEVGADILLPDILYIKNLLNSKIS